MKQKEFSSDFIQLVKLEYPNLPKNVENNLQKSEGIVTRYLDENSTLADVNTLHKIGKDNAWDMIERSVYRKYMHKVAVSVLNPTEDNIRDEEEFIKKYKGKLNGSI